MRYKRFEGTGLVKNKIGRNLLLVLGVSLAVPVFLSSPYGLYYLVRGATRMYFKKYAFRRELQRLERRGFVALTKDKDGFFLRLTKKGLEKFRKIKIEELELKPQKRWDKKWRFFIFDIPEKERSRRDMIRSTLKKLGLYNIQRSVFAYPYDCRKELAYISDFYRVGKYSTFMEGDYIDIDKELRRHFHLS